MARRYVLGDGSAYLSGFEPGGRPDGGDLPMVTTIPRPDIGFATRAQLDEFLNGLDADTRAAVDALHFEPMELDV
jgi:hypothetical protein